MVYFVLDTNYKMLSAHFYLSQLRKYLNNTYRWSTNILFNYQLIKKTIYILLIAFLFFDLFFYFNSKSTLIYNRYEHIDVIDRTPDKPFYDVNPQNNIFIDKYKLHYCRIDKAMSSAMQAILCYLDDQKEHDDMFFNQQWQPGMSDSACGRSTRLGKLRERFFLAAHQLDFFEKTSGILHFAIIRDPIDRFVSAFLDICVRTEMVNTKIAKYTDKQIETLKKGHFGGFAGISEPEFKYRAKMCHGMNEVVPKCYDCGTNLTCFVQRLHADLLRRANHLAPELWYLDWHFYPMAWNCDFQRYMDSYRVIRYERTDAFRNEMIQMFREVGVTNALLTQVEEKMRTKNTTHATFAKRVDVLNEIRQNPLLLEYIYKIYYLDFQWFDYKM